jgi:hypothetical protein
MAIRIITNETSEYSANGAADLQSAWFRINTDGVETMTIKDKDAGAFRAFWSGACIGIKWAA